MTYRIERMQWNTAKDLDIEQIMADPKATSDELKSCVESLQAEIERLRDELLISSQLVAACQKDAARYRWLKQKAIYIDPTQRILRICNVYLKGDIANTLDAAIDAAIKGGE